MHEGFWWETQRRPLGKSRRLWENTTKMDLKELGRQGVNWIDLAYDGDKWQAVVKTVMNL